MNFSRSTKLTQVGAYLLGGLTVYLEMCYCTDDLCNISWDEMVEWQDNDAVQRATATHIVTLIILTIHFYIT